MCTRVKKRQLPTILISMSPAHDHCVVGFAWSIKNEQYESAIQNQQSRISNQESGFWGFVGFFSANFGNNFLVDFLHKSFEIRFHFDEVLVLTSG